MLMQVIAQGWGTKSDLKKSEFRELIKKLKVSNWSRDWEYPFIILNSDIHSGLRTLDGGCKGSYLLQYCIEKGCETFGIDLNDLSISGLHFGKADIQKLPFHSNSFDRVFCISVIEHIWNDPMRSINELIRVLKPNGRLAITVDINRTNSHYQFSQLDFNLKIGRPLRFDTGIMPNDILKSEDTKMGRVCGFGLSVFGFVLEK